MVGGKSVKTALVVEDEPLIRMGAVDLCEMAGLVVLEAGNSDQALALLRTATSLSLIHTDIDMPGSVDGVALAWQARAMHPDIAVIVVSGKMTVDQQALPPRARFFSKPVQDAELLAAISELVPT